MPLFRSISIFTSPFPKGSQSSEAWVFSASVWWKRCVSRWGCRSYSQGLHFTARFVCVVFFFFQFIFSYLYFNNNINTILSAWPNSVIHRYCLRDFGDHYELYWWIPWPIALHCDSNFKLCVVDKHHYYRVNVICLMMCMYMCKSERIIKLEALWSMGRT